VDCTDDASIRPGAAVGCYPFTFGCFGALRRAKGSHRSYNVDVGRSYTRLEGLACLGRRAGLLCLERLRRMGCLSAGPTGPTPDAAGSDVELGSPGQDSARV